MGKCAVWTKRSIVFLATLLQIGIAVAIIWLISDRLTNGEAQCALDDSRANNDSILCTLGYIGVSITFLLLFIEAILSCITCDWCGLGFCFEGSLQLILAAAWVVYAVWVTTAANNISNWPEDAVSWNTDETEAARTSVVILSWAEAVMLFILGAINYLSPCCCKDERHKSRDEGFSEV